MIEDSALVFLGKFDLKLLNLEERVLHLNQNPVLSNDQCLLKKYETLDIPDVISYKIKGYKCKMYAIMGDVRPTLLLKSLLTQSRIIIFVFNLNEVQTLDFLLEGWGPIIKKVKLNDPSTQQRFLIGTQTNSNFDHKEILRKVCEIKKELNCEFYFEENASKDSTEIIDDCEIKIHSNLIEKIIENIDKDNKKDNDEHNDEYEEEYEEGVEENDDDDDDDEIIEEEEEVEKDEIVSDPSKFNFFKDTKSISYKLYEETRTAEITESKNQNIDIIPTFATYKSEDYKITRICENAFSDSKSESLSFSKSSKIRSIGNNAFERSSIENIILPASLKKLDENWCQGAEKLMLVKVNKKNRDFSTQKNVLIYKKLKENGNILIKEILFIPRYFKGGFLVSEGITGIGNYAFFNCQKLTRFKSETSSLKSIKSYSFHRCENLKTIKIKGCLELSLGNYCFTDLNSLSSIEIECNDIIIGEGCFSNCISLSSIALSKVTNMTINSNSFLGCLSKINVKNDKNELHINVINNLLNPNCLNFIHNCSSLLYIDAIVNEDIALFSKTFENCSSLQKIRIYSSSKIILKPKCFEKAQQLRIIELKSKTLEMDPSCFHNSQNATHINLQSEDPISIYQEMFDKCDKLMYLSLIADFGVFLNDGSINSLKNLSSVYLRSDKIYIGDVCFKNCTSLSVFIIAESGDIQIGKYQFFNCNNLQEIIIRCIEINKDNTIPKIELDSNCFSSCKSLQSVTIESKSIVIFGEDSVCGLSNLHNLSISCQEIIIHKECFKECTSLGTIKINNADKIVIKMNAFYNCKSIEKVEFNAKSVLSFGENCFIGSGIKSAIFQGKKIKIHDNCFKGCKLIDKFQIKSSQEVEIGSCAFEVCNELKNVSINSTSKITIFNHCFALCQKLESIDFQCKELVISGFCFYNCTSIESFLLDDSNIIILKESSFEGCSNLTSISANAKLYFEAGLSCFVDANKLENIGIVSKKVVICDYCFNNCNSINSATIISDNEVKLGKMAFAGCKNITIADIKAQNTFIADNSCFANAQKLATVKINSKHIFLGNYCFSKCISLNPIECNSVQKITYVNNSFDGVKIKKRSYINSNAQIEIVSPNSNNCIIF